MKLIIHYQFSLEHRKFLRKSFLIMKLLVFFLAINCLQLCAEGYGQKITLSVQNAPVQQVFKQIEKQSDYSFIYAREQVAKMNPVNVNVVQADLITVLNLVFKQQGFTYTISGNNIVIKEKVFFAINKIDYHAPLSYDVSGKITDADGTPLAGATIKLEGSKTTAVADQNGSFTLPSKAINGILEISFVGYETMEITFSQGKNLAVVLKRNETKAEEVVVVGYGTQKKATLSGSVSTVKGNDIASVPVANVTNMLAGRVPGLIAYSNSSEPGNDKANLLIRG